MGSVGSQVMMRVVLKPDGWPCTIKEAPPGPIIFQGNNHTSLWFKSEYGNDNKRDGSYMAYNEAGEFLAVDQSTTFVQPVEVVIEEEEIL